MVIADVESYRIGSLVPASTARSLKEREVEGRRY